MGFTFELTKADLAAHLASTHIALTRDQIDDVFAELDVEGIEELVLLSDKTPQQALFDELQKVLRGHGITRARFEVMVVCLDLAEGVSQPTIGTHLNVDQFKLLSKFIFDLAADADDFPAPLYAWVKQMENAANYIESGRPPERFDPKHPLKARNGNGHNGNGNGHKARMPQLATVDVDPRAPGEIQ